MWSEHRRVTKTATLSLHGNSYEVDTALVGRQVEVVFDPLDLTSLEVRYQGRSMGLAVPHRIGRHVHPQARPDLPPPPASKTGVDYLGLIAAQHRAQVAVRINYTGLLSSDQASAPPADEHDEHDEHGSEHTAHPEPTGAAMGTPNTTGLEVEPDRQLRQELASFALLGKKRVSTQIPGQLDLIYHDPSDHDPSDHDPNSDSTNHSTNEEHR